MVKIKPFEEVEKYLKKWPTWLGIVLLFLPGILYQLEIRGDITYLNNFQGILIVVFLALSLYYSLPFILIGILGYMALEMPRNPWNEAGFFNTSVLAIFSYWVFFLFVRAGNLDLTLLQMFYSYMGIIIFLFILGMIRMRKEIRKK